MTRNDPYLRPVSARIADAILEFCASRLAAAEFHADDLRRHVAQRTGIVAPASADRVLRDLRQKGAVAYEVVNRAGSLYRVTEVNPAWGLL